jgi:hypothetical protein
MWEDADPTEAPVFVPSLPERDGTNAIERKAVYRAQLEIRSMPASLVVQIALWPDKLADWAKETGIAPAVVYNMLAGVKPYHRVRTLLARRLNVSKHVLDYLVDAPRPEPLAKVPPDPPADFTAPPLPSFAEVPERPRHPPRSRRSRRTSEAGSASQIALNI